MAVVQTVGNNSGDTKNPSNAQAGPAQRNALAAEAIVPDKTKLAATISAVCRREQFHEQIVDGHLLEDRFGQVVFHGHTRDSQLKTLLDGLTRLHPTILESDMPPCEAVTVRSGDGLPSLPGYKLTRLGGRVHTCCKQFLATGDDGSDWLLAYDNHLFNPTMTVMLRAFRRWANDAGYWLDAKMPVVHGSPDAVAVRALTRLVKFVRRVCGTWAFKNELAKYTRKADANFKSACSLVIDRFGRCSRLLVLRVDLYLRPEFKAWGYGPDAEKAAQRFFRWLRGRRLPGYLGSIVKRENGIDRGMHWHWMVLLDGHQHRDACGLGKLLGETWIELVGRARGSYFNCYARQHEYRFNGLGLVHANDAEKLMGVRAALWYMTKRDCVLRTDNAKHQDFRRSKPREVSAKRRGAPRKNDDGLALAKRLLGGKRSKYPPGFEP